MGAIRFGLIFKALLGTAIALLGPSVAYAQASPTQANPTQSSPTQSSLTMGTASVGGTYYVYGEAVARVLVEKARLPVVAEQTQGPNQNIVMVDEKKFELGMVSMGVALQGLQGTAAWTKGRKFENIRALFPMYETVMQCVALRKSGIADFKALEGKAVGVGPKAGTPGTYFPLIFDALGMKVQVSNGPSADMGHQLNDGIIDAYCFGAGFPIPAFSDLDATLLVVFFTPTDGEIARIRKALPELSESAVPKDTYKQLPVDQKTVGVFNFAIANKDVGDDVAYLITKTILENTATLVRAHPAAKDTVAANARRNSFLPFHPGAVRYYKEKGIKLDPAALPQ
jgi:TRAP transporter TAXI family solute receptor